MGLDVALGIVILIAAIRGWLQGFIYQVIRIGGLIASFYLAAPVRDEVKPHVGAYLASIPADWVDRILWWVAVSVNYIVIVGACTLAVKMTRRPDVPGLPPQRSRNDQFAGFLLGLVKGGVIAAFLVAGLVRYVLEQVETIPWALEQARTSQAIVWNDQYHPASRIWRSAPVTHLAKLIHEKGLQGPAESPSSSDPDSDAPGSDEAFPVAQTARKGPGHTPRNREAQEAPPAPPASGSTGPEAVRDPASSAK